MMSTPKKVFYLLLSMLGIVLVPYIGAYIHFDGIFDSHYFDFPPLSAEHTYDDFSWIVFYGVGFFFVVTMMIYVFPRLFGFKKPLPITNTTPRPKVAFPSWFWWGGGVWLVVLGFLLGHFSSPKWLLNWAYVPLYWGLTFLLDGIVYKRTGGKSMFNNDPQELVGIGVSSTAGWLIFEYLNFFVLEFWYYPNGEMIPDAQFCTYAIFASSALLPLGFQFYSLFNSFPRFVSLYQNGIKIRFGKNMQVLILVASYIGLFLMSFMPDILCPVIWLAPLFILTCMLDLLGIWSPFTPITKGNWSPVLLTALTYLVSGFLLEGQNFLSATHEGGVLHSHLPGYWVYNVPFINKFHVFEMPVMGFYGYLPFGIYCLVWWICFAFTLNIPTNFAKYESPVY